MLFLGIRDVNQDRSPARADTVVQSAGPAIGNVVTRTNSLLSEHRDWLASPPQRKNKNRGVNIDTISPPPKSLITPAPDLSQRLDVWRRQNLVQPLPECSGLVSAASSSAALAASRNVSVTLSSVASTCAATILSLQLALLAAQSSLSSVKASALSALSTASINVISASSSASVAIASAQASAVAAIATVQSSASAAVISANIALASANSAAVSASNAANNARASATLAEQAASNSVQAAIESATASAKAFKAAAMNTTILALTITFSILGSSIISIIIVYLIARYRRNRRQKKQNDLKEKIYLRNSQESSGPSLSAFPMPVGRKNWFEGNGIRGGGGRGMSAGERPDTMDAQEMLTASGPLTGSETLRNDSVPGSANLLSSGALGKGRSTWASGRPNQNQRASTAFPFVSTSAPGNKTRKTWVARDAIPEGREGGGGAGPSSKSVLTRKTTLTYDPENPDRPPKFTTWVEESFIDTPFRAEENRRSSSVLGYNQGGVRISMGAGAGAGASGGKKQDLIQRRRSKSMGEMSEVSEIGTAI